MSYRNSFLFCSDMILMRFVSSSFQPWSRALVGINNTSIFGLEFSQYCGGFPIALYLHFARHCCLHRNFQLCTSGFRCELQFFVAWFNEEYSSQLSGIVELWFLDSPFLFCFLFRCVRHMLPHVWPHIVWTRGCLFPCKSLTGQVYPSGGLSFNKMNLVKPVHGSDNSFSPPTFPVIFNMFLHQYVQ